MSVSDVLALVVGIVVIIGVPAVIWFVQRRVSNTFEAAAKRLNESVAEASKRAQDDFRLAPRPRILVPEYLDDGLFREIAEQLGVPTGPVETRSGRSITVGDGGRAKVSGQLTAPGVGKLGADVEGGSIREERSLALESIQRRGSFRRVMDEVIAQAEAADLLATDVDVLPASAEPEAVFLQGCYVLRHEWDLDSMGPEHEEGSDDEDGADIEDGESSSAQAVAEELGGALSRVELLAMDVLTVEARRRLQETVEDSQFALVDNLWHVRGDVGDRSLHLVRLRTEFSPRGTDDLVDVPTEAIVSVALDEDNLLAHGRTRFLPGDFERVTVFGKVEGIDEETGCLLLFPIAIYSSE